MKKHKLLDNISTQPGERRQRGSLAAVYNLLMGGKGRADIDLSSMVAQLNEDVSGEV